MTDHPDDLLAEYIDGSLGPHERARVDAHLDTCTACREDAVLATRGREALGALPEEEPPAGLGMAAVREARSRRGRGLPTWATWGAAAAAAVLVGVVAFASLSPLVDGDEAASPTVEEEAPGAPQPEEEAPLDGQPEASRAGSAPAFRAADTDHDAASVQRLARSLRGDVEAALEAGFAPTAESFYRGFDVETLPEPAVEALACATRAFSPDRGVVPFLVERSSFEGDPAFVSAFLQGPSPGTEYDRLVLVVADAERCSLQTYASQRL